MKKLNSVWAYCCRHKYLLTIIIGVLIVGVVDENSMRRYIANQMRINELTEDIEQYSEQFEKDSLKLRNLIYSSKGVERVARERYLMKRPNEDIYVISE